MPITRSQENLSNIEQPTNCSFTVSMDEPNTSQAPTQSRSARRPTNRNQNRENSEVRLRQIVSESMTALRSEMTDLISSELRSFIRNFNTNDNTNDNTNSRVPTNSHSANNEVPNIPTNSLSSLQEPFIGEKVSNIIRNWRVKFSGCEEQMTVDEFVYRINVLTTNNLNGNFDLLCKHAHILFEGKALDFYWRFHRHDNDLDWLSLTRALRDQYKSDYTDFDIMEDIHRRKQRNNETFDDFFNSISTLTDRLKNSISDGDLCTILVRNLRTEIRHELLHLDISSVSQLRREVKKHEKFVKDISSYEVRKNAKARVAEIDTSKEVNILETSEDNSDVCAIRAEVKCWNCDKQGHIFCYGCGAKDTYRPNCPKCGKRQQGNGLKDVRRP